MRTKNTKRVFRKYIAMADGEYVPAGEVGLDPAALKGLNKKIAAFAEKQKLKLARKRTLKEVFDISEDEESETDSQGSQDEISESEGEVQEADQDKEPEEEAELPETQSVAIEETRETEAPTNHWRVIHNEYAYVSPPEELEQNTRETTEAEIRERAEQEDLRKREEKAKEKQTRQARERISDPDYEISNEVTEAETGSAKKKKKAEETEFTPEEYYKAFMATGFLGTWYPDKDLMKRMQIDKDVDDILRCISMERFAVTAYPTYPKLAAEFLSTLTIIPMPGSVSREMYGGGMITFKAKGKPTSLNFNKIDEFFGFKGGKAEQLDVSKEDQIRIWSAITGVPGEPLPDKLPSQPKGTMIRNPAINYARRIIAETFFSRSDTGVVSSQDMQLMAFSLSKLIEFETPALGDTAGAGLSFVLCKHLESFKTKVQTITRRNQKMAKMTIGGAITGLLALAGVSFTENNREKIPPRLMDEAYLRVHNFLTGPEKKDEYYYQFPTPSNPSAIIRLPKTDLTNLNEQENYVFIPPQNLLTDITALPPIPEKAPAAQTGLVGPSKQKKEVTKAPPGKGTTKTCVCTQKGYREKLVAEIENSLQKKFQRQLTEIESSLQKKHQREIAKLTETFVRRPMIYKTPPVLQTRTKRSPERPTVRSTSGTIVRARLDDDDEDIEDTIPLSKRAATMRLKARDPASKGA